MDVTISVITLLVVGAFAVAIASAMGRAPLYIAVILLCIIEAAQLGLLT